MRSGAKNVFCDFFVRGVRLQFSLCAPIVPLRDATLLQMTQLQQVTGILYNKFMAHTPRTFRRYIRSQHYGCERNGHTEHYHHPHTRNHARDLCADWRSVSSQQINGHRAKTSRKTMRQRVPPLQNSKNPHAKRAAKPPTFGALFSGSGGVERAGA